MAITIFSPEYRVAQKSSRVSNASKLDENGQLADVCALQWWNGQNTAVAVFTLLPDGTTGKVERYDKQGIKPCLHRALFPFTLCPFTLLILMQMNEHKENFFLLTIPSKWKHFGILSSHNVRFYQISKSTHLTFITFGNTMPYLGYYIPDLFPHLGHHYYIFFNPFQHVLRRCMQNLTNLLVLIFCSAGYWQRQTTDIIHRGRNYYNSYLQNSSHLLSLPIDFKLMKTTWM